MEIIILQQRISRYLNELYDLIEMQNSNGEFALNKASENIFRDILNTIYDYQLENTNLRISNYPSIDLISTNNAKVCYQVSVTNDIKKIKETLNSFFSNGLYKLYDTINFIILKSARKYNKESFEEHLCSLLKQFNITTYNFNINDNIIDSSYMYRIIANLSDSSKLIKIYNLLSEYSSGKKTETNLSKYYDSLKEDFYEVVMEDTMGMTLSDIYIDPEFQYYHPLILEDALKHGNTYHSDFNDLKKSEKNIIESFLYEDFSVLSRIFIKPKASVLFILGYPGQGKTSFCKRLIHSHFDASSEVPLFYLKLRNVRNTRALIDNPLKVIHEELEEEVEQEFNKSLLKKSIIILDGLDELYMKDNLKADDIERFCKELIRESQRLKYNKIVVTTRYGYIDLRRIYEDGYVALSLKPLNLLKQVEWLEKYKVFHPETWLSVEKLNNFNARDSSLTYIKELINQPLLLYIIASLNVELNQNTDRSEIYNLLFDQIIDRKYSKDGQIDILRHLSKEDLRSLLQEVAYLIFISGKEYATEEELLSAYAVKEYISKISNNNLAGTLKGVLISFYFKESRIKSGGNKSETGIEFLHKSLQEFLAAEKIVESTFNDLLDKDKKDKYILKYDSSLLEWLNDLFGKQPLTSEIAGYINDIIPKKDQDSKNELAVRLVEHLKYFVEKDFLYKHEASEKDPLNKILMVFQSYWFILSILEQNKNYLESYEVSSKVVFYFNSLASNRAASYGIYISNQIFNNAFVNFLQSTEEEMVENVIFNHSHISSNTWMFKTLINVNINNCHIYNLDLFETVFKDCLFDGCTIHVLELYNTRFSNVQFKNCRIESTKFYYDNPVMARCRKLQFSNVIFDERSYEIFSNKKFASKFKNCKILYSEKDIRPIE